MKTSLAVVAAALFANSASAEIVVQRWPAAGTLPDGVELFGTTAAGTADLSERGQTFTSDHSGKLLALDVLFSRITVENRPDPEFELSLFDRPGGTQIASKVFTAPPELGSNLQWVSVDFSDAQASLTSGLSLFYRLVETGVSSGTGVNQNIIWYGAVGPAHLLYGGGQAMEKLSYSCPACGVWRPLDPFLDGRDADMAFRLHIDTSATAVPEPAAWTMMIGGFGLLGEAVRRRRRITFTYA